MTDCVSKAKQLLFKTISYLARQQKRLLQGLIERPSVGRSRKKILNRAISEYNKTCVCFLKVLRYVKDFGIMTGQESVIEFRIGIFNILTFFTKL